MLADTPASFGSSPENDRCSDPAFIREIVTHPVNGLFAYFDAEGACQSVAGLVRMTGSKRSHVVQVYGVYTRPGARRQGHGRRVMEAVLDYAAKLEGVEIAGLSVSSEAPAAQAMYEAQGFEAWGREPQALRIGDRRPAEIHMWRPMP